MIVLGKGVGLLGGLERHPQGARALCSPAPRCLTAEDPRNLPDLGYTSVRHQGAVSGCINAEPISHTALVGSVVNQA